jgi:GNAT superfamily N-acetyltransferase
MYVHPGHQGKGIGGRLITAALQHISPLEGLEKVCLSVTDQSPAAHKLYLKMGFSEYGREANAMQWEGLLMTEIFMHKIL